MYLRHPVNPRTSRLRVTVLCTAAVLTTCACGDGESIAPPPVEPVAWSECDLGFECGAVTVPVDYDHPNAGTLSVAVVRSPAMDPAHRIGSLVFNPGGPGLSGVATLRLVAGLFPAPLRERFDLVSFDPRGTRDSGKIDCGTDVSALVSALPLPAAAGAPLPRRPSDVSSKPAGFAPTAPSVRILLASTMR